MYPSLSKIRWRGIYIKKVKVLPDLTIAPYTDSNRRPIMNLPHVTPALGGAPLALKILDATPVEGIAILITSFAIRVFSTTLATPLLAIGVSVVAARLVLKVMDCYNPVGVVRLTKHTCELEEAYPKLHIVALVAAIALSYISAIFGILVGIGFGCLFSITLDVKKCKLQQQANRKLLAAAKTTE